VTTAGVLHRRGVVAGTSRARGRALLSSATLWLDAQYSVPGEQTAVNRGTGGAALNATYGSTASLDINDPLLLPHAGENYVWFPGSTGNQLQSTNVARTLDSSFDWRFDVPRPSVVANQRVGQHGIYLDFVPGNNVVGTFAASDATFPGVTATAAAVNAVIPLGTRGHLRINWDPATDVLSLFGRAPGLDLLDDNGWTLLNSATHAGKMADASNRLVRLGNGDGSIYEGQLYGSALSYNGSMVHHLTDARIAAAGPTTLTDATGLVFSIQRTTTDRKTAIVTRPIWLFGTDDYFEIPDNALLDFNATEDLTLVAVARHWPDATSAGGRLVIRKQSGATAGYQMTNNRQMVFSDGVVQPVTGSTLPVAGVLRTSTGSRNGATKLLSATNNNVAVANVADVTTLSAENAVNFSVGGSLSDMELAAVAVFRRVLTTAEIAAINVYYGTA
jgi:hypothetical protein